MSADGFRRYLTAAVAVRLADEGARVALVLRALGGVLVAALLIPHVVAVLLARGAAGRPSPAD